MSRGRSLYIAADVALLASLVIIGLLYRHYGLIDEQEKSLWLQRREWLDAALYVSVTAAALLFAAGLIVRRKGPGRSKELS